MSRSEVPSPETVSALLILAAVFHAFALILTSFRLWFRYHVRRLWWDDFWATLALLCDAVCMVTMWTLSAPVDKPYTNFEALPTRAQSRSAHIISYWLSIIFYTCSIWSARLSIVFSLVRIVPPARSVCVTVLSTGVAFACMWAYVLASKSVVCAVDKSWYNAVVIQCPMANWVALSEVCTDIASDVLLVVLPFRFLWRVRLPSKQRNMVLSVFSTSILVSVVSVVHTSYLIPSASFIAGVTAEIEGAVSLIVCNLLVLVSFIYRVTRNDAECDETIGSSNRLTTVDLELSAGSLFTRTTVGTRTTRFTGTGTQRTETGTGTGTGTGTDLSSLKFASMSDTVTMGGSVPVLPAVAVGRNKDLGMPVTAKK